MRVATRSSSQRRTRGDLRLRFLVHHVPLALASAVLLVVFMGLPPFDANSYPHVDIFSSAFPQQRDRGEGGPMQQGGGRQSGERRGGGHHSGRRRGGAHHSGRRRGGGHEPSRQQGTGDSSRLIRSPEEVQDRSFVRRFTVATSYVALALLSFTLLIGPANLLRRRRNPVSSYLRRDAGTWTAIFSLVHVIYGLQMHERLSDFLRYFVAPDGSPLTNSFGLGNWTGLAAVVIVAGLLALSSDAALRKLKAKNWKRLQRLNYALFALVIVHAFFYGAALRTDSPYTLLLLVSVIAVFVGQAVGIGLYRQRYSRRAAIQRERRSARATP
jgi:sulfoxide reductase heme-binding subunit YedZ